MLFFFMRCLVYLFALVASFQALQALNFEKLIKPNHVWQAQLLFALLVVALAYLVGSFFNAFLYFMN